MPFLLLFMHIAESHVPQQTCEGKAYAARVAIKARRLVIMV